MFFQCNPKGYFCQDDICIEPTIEIPNKTQIWHQQGATKNSNEQQRTAMSNKEQQ
jgi:hypothetical protein